MTEMIYNYKTHSLNCSKDYIGVYSLTINYVELVLDYHTDEFIDIFGFLPLVNAQKCKIELPEYKNGKVYLNISDKSQIIENSVYNYSDKVVNPKEYFKNTITKFDDKKGVICIGDNIVLESDNVIKVNKNLICVVDLNNSLKCIYIIPDIFLK
ncbi:MAG: hypothetical protein IJH39_06180 [Clostridia bacterium]|nr:hypothetical protein [Clostridia bacterium]